MISSCSNYTLPDPSASARDGVRFYSDVSKSMVRDDSICYSTICSFSLSHVLEHRPLITADHVMGGNDSADDAGHFTCPPLHLLPCEKSSAQVWPHAAPSQRWREFLRWRRHRGSNGPHCRAGETLTPLIIALLPPRLPTYPLPQAHNSDILHAVLCVDTIISWSLLFVLSVALFCTITLISCCVIIFV